MLRATLLSIIVTAVGYVSAGFDPTSKSNIVLYWGQNSAGHANNDITAQSRLSHYCDNTDVDVINIAFLIKFNGGDLPDLNFANQGGQCTSLQAPTIFCPQIRDDIKACQSKGKTVLLSLGGATYTEGGFPSSSAAIDSATKLWATFGPENKSSNALRPFGTSSVDGFDFDFETPVTHMIDFATQLRTLMDAATGGGKKYYLSAVPQCAFPDQNNAELLNNVHFDLVNVQFYNTPFCAANASGFSFSQWDEWARKKAPSPRVLMGVPAGETAVTNGGYLTQSELKLVIGGTVKNESFGGVMIWDASQAWKNEGFIGGVKSALKAGA